MSVMSVDNHQMDPETEDLVYSRQLRNFMHVLLSDEAIRKASPNRFGRWATVTNLVVDEAEKATTFIGVFEDGSKAVMSTGLTNGWYVKKDSMGTVVDDTKGWAGLSKFLGWSK